MRIERFEDEKRALFIVGFHLLIEPVETRLSSLDPNHELID